ncbi:MAG: germination protein YpeB, partial [Clostridia bacterium]|nr:germination protein YpeB [Clostridia bacterium]
MDKIRNTNWARALSVALGILLISMIGLNIQRTNALADAQMRIGAVYQKAFYETVQLTEAVSSNLKKLSVAGDDARTIALLGDISRETQAASSNLALLPLGEETVSATIKFINQTEDFAESLSNRIAAGGKLTENDFETLSALGRSAAEFHSAMLALLSRYESGEAVFDASDFSVNGDEGLYPITNTADSYPRLLYDGPFSDAEATGDFEFLKALPEITQQQAQQRLEAFIPVTNVRFTGESHPEIDCYEFTAFAGNTAISAAVTKNGGMILYILPENDVTEAKIDADTLIKTAEIFLQEKGFGDMQMSYYSAFDGILTVNFAAVQDEVVIYPELVKLQISMADGGIIGMDAGGYLRNHRARTFPEAAIDAEAAKEKISPKLNALSARLCVIPKDGREYFAWEIRAADAEAGYLVYIDAENGIERDLMQIVSAAQGTLVM